MRKKVFTELYEKIYDAILGKTRKIVWETPEGKIFIEFYVCETETKNGLLNKKYNLLKMKIDGIFPYKDEHFYIEKFFHTMALEEKAEMCAYYLLQAPLLRRTKRGVMIIVDFNKKIIVRNIYHKNIIFNSAIGYTGSSLFCYDLMLNETDKITGKNKHQVKCVWELPGLRFYDNHILYKRPTEINGEVKPKFKQNNVKKMVEITYALTKENNKKHTERFSSFKENRKNSEDKREKMFNYLNSFNEKKFNNRFFIPEQDSNETLDEKDYFNHMLSKITPLKEFSLIDYLFFLMILGIFNNEMVHYFKKALDRGIDLETLKDLFPFEYEKALKLIEEKYNGDLNTKIML